MLAVVAILVFGGLAALAVYGGYFSFGEGPGSDGSRNSLLPDIQLPLSPTEVTVAASQAFDLSPEQWTSYSFELPNRQPCVMSGRIVVVAGGSHDVDLFVVDEDGYMNFRHGQGFEGWTIEKRTAAHTFDARLPSPGKYHLIVSNRFSIFTPKTVQIEDIKTTCG